MPVRYGRPPKRNRRSRRCRVANDDDVCVGMSTIGEDDVVAAAAVDDLEVRAGGAGAAHSLPPLPRDAGGGAASFAAGAAASAALLARTHVSRFDGGRYALDAASERGCLTAATDGGVAAAAGGDDAYAPGFDVVVAGRLRCTVRERLGAGSFGAVYRAAGPPRCGRRRDFALKAVRAADLAPARRRALERRLTTEAALSISLGTHPQLVGVLYLLPKLASVPSTAGGMLIAMELVRGCDLGAALAGAGALYAGGAAAAGARASSLSRQLLCGLAHMHARGVMHQDVKPANLLLDAAGRRLRVSDYGLAAFTTSARGDPWVPAFAGRVVRAAFTGCTPRYLSPEGLRVHAVLARAASRDEYEGLRRRHAMTPAVSDC